MFEIIRRECLPLVLFQRSAGAALPYWVLGMLLGSAVSVFLKDKIHNTFRAIGEKKDWYIGHCCRQCSWDCFSRCVCTEPFPIAASFSKGGIKDDWLAAFMMSSVLLNPQLILYSAALGTTALVVRIASPVLCVVLLLVCWCVFFIETNRFSILKDLRTPRTVTLTRIF